MNGWTRLREELDAWGAAGRTATFWWRDDDATQATMALHRLMDLSGQFDAPVALAVIPRDINGSLPELIGAHARVSVLQHGWGHANHAPDGDRQEEYGPHRPREEMVAELAEGWQRTRTLPRALPVLVAPWNRMDEDLIPCLPEAGLGGVSTLGPRRSPRPAGGVRQTNVHVDIMDWHGSGGFVGADGAIDQVLQHLTMRRRGEVDETEPTGLMTHHLFHDEGCWQFTAAFLACIRDHPAARWLHGREVFWS